MVTINAGDDVFVMIVQLSVAPSDLQGLITDMTAQTESWVRRCTGFISSSFHASEDGQRLVIYALWRSCADWEAAMKHPGQRGIGDALEAAGAEMFEWRGYTVVRTIGPAPPGTG